TGIFRHSRRKISVNSGKIESDMGDKQSIREKILADIRLALHDVRQQAGALPVVENCLVFKKWELGLAESFVRVFTSIDGQVIRCEDEVQLKAKLEALLRERNWKKVAGRSLVLERYD